MTDHERAKEHGVHGNTVKAARAAIAKKQISRQSFEAVMEGRLSLDEARELGREGSPFGPAPKAVSKTDRSRECMCGCGRETRGRFAMGHDQVLLRFAYEYAKGERELTPEQLAYVRDETNKLDRARQRVEVERERERKASERKAKNKK